MLRRKPLTKTSWRNNHNVPGDEYELVFSGKTVSLAGRFVIDRTSPDGRRWIATRESNRQIWRIVYALAGGRCQVKLPGCWGWTPMSSGHPHHVKHAKMGGGWRDDRVFLEGEQIRVWICAHCHQRHHNRLHWSGAKRREEE